MGDKQMDQYGPGAGAYPASPPPGVGSGYQQQWPPTPGQSAKPVSEQPKPDPKQRRILLIAGGVTAAVLVALVVGGYFGFKHLNENVYSPQVLAEEYLQAIVDGDVERAIEMSPDNNWQDYSLMTNEAYAKAENTITGFEVTDVAVVDGKADVSVDIEQGNDTHAVTLDLRTDGTEALFFDTWKLNIGLVTDQVTYITRGEPDAATVNGVAIDQDINLADAAMSFDLLPGDYTLGASTGTEYAAYPDHVVSVGLGGGLGANQTVEFKAEVTEDGREKIQAGLTAHLEECMKATELMPTGCPNRWTAEDPENYRNISWTMPTPPTLEPIEGDPAAPFLVKAVNGKMVLESEVKRGGSWEPERQEAPLYWMYAEVEISGGDLSMRFAD